MSHYILSHQTMLVSFEMSYMDLLRGTASMSSSPSIRWPKGPYYSLYMEEASFLEIKGGVRR